MIELTAQCKKMLEKIVDKNSSDEMRTKAREVLDRLKGQMAELSKGIDEQERKQAEVYNKKMMERQMILDKQIREMSEIRQLEMTLDLRPKSVKVNELPVELSQATVLAEYIRAMGLKEFTEVVWLSNRDSAIIRFANHAAAEVVFKHEVAFKPEWISNEEADHLAQTNEIETLEAADEEPRVEDATEE